MPRLTDIWRCGIAHASMADIARHQSIAGIDVTWLPAGPPFTFLADPFGVYHNGQRHLFAEAYDYRDRRGRIDVLRLDSSFGIVDRTTCLSEPWHLSYPFIIEDDGQVWMLPEAHRSGKLTLYRAVDFPLRWEPAGILLDEPAVDASPVFFNGLWWMFYSSAASKHAKQSVLYLAFSERLTGPWRPHPANPVRIDRSSGRPGGTPIIVDGQLRVPAQDCRKTYGGAIRMLRVLAITPEKFEAVADDPISANRAFAPFDEGFHTISACGDVTLIDAKRIDRSLGGLRIEIGRRLRNPTGRR